MQRDHLIEGIAGQIQRIIAAAVPDAEERIEVGGEIIGPAHGGIEAIGGIARVIGHIGPVKLVQGQQVIEHQRIGIAVHRAGGIALVEIAHQRVLVRVLCKLGIVGIGDRDAKRGVVITRMGQAKRMADLVQQHEIAVAAHRQRGCAARIVIQPDIAGIGADRCIARQIGIGTRAVIGGIGAKDHRGVIRGGIWRNLRQGQPADPVKVAHDLLDGGDLGGAGGDKAVATVGFRPKVTDRPCHGRRGAGARGPGQIRADQVARAHCHIIVGAGPRGHRQTVVPGRGPVVRLRIYIMGPACGGGKGDGTVDARTTIIIEGDFAASTVAQAQIGIAETVRCGPDTHHCKCIGLPCLQRDFDPV